MKKCLFLSLVLSILLSSGIAMAFPLDFSGDLRFQYRQYKDDIDISSIKGNEINLEQGRIRLNFSGDIRPDVTVFGRFSSTGYWGGTNFGADHTGLDQYGVKLAYDGWNYRLGRQAVMLGQGSIIGTGNEALACDNKFDGVIASRKVGDIDLNIVLGKTNAALAGNPSSWMGFDISGKLGDNLTLGGAFATEKITDSSQSVPARKYWALNAAYKISQAFTLAGEYVTSRAPGSNPYNNGYFVAATYSVDKDSFSVQYNNVGINSVDGANSAIGGIYFPLNGLGLVSTTNGSVVPAPGDDTKYSGFCYSYTHQINKEACFNVTYMDLKVDAAKGHDKELAMGFIWSF